ncbi:hypothetical protein D3C84_142250 [compost metagenome]
MDWLTALGQAFSNFGDVSQMVVPDNPRVLIAHPDRYEPGLNRATLECARHYDTVMPPTRPRKPQDKAKAEVAVRWAEIRNLEALLGGKGTIGSAVTERTAIMDDNLSRNFAALRSLGVTHHDLPN